MNLTFFKNHKNKETLNNDLFIEHTIFNFNNSSKI